MKKLLGAALALSLMAGTSLAADYPEREILGVVMWGAGGATDTVARAVNPAAEEALGKPIVVLNKSGGAGAISTAFVNAAPADGYTFLYGAKIHNYTRLWASLISITRNSTQSTFWVAALR